jgi:uncharacterized protein (TIGR04222 family)
MDFLLDNPLATMEGTTFLVLYAVFVVLALFTLAVAKSNIDKTDQLPIPAIPPQIDPYEIAYLRSGINEMARSVVFSLVQKGFVEIVNDDRNGKVRRLENVPDSRGLNQIEQLALKWTGSEREAKDVFDSSFGLVEQLEPYGLTYHAQLERRQLLASDDLGWRAKRLGLIVALLIAGIGGYKILAAILNGNFNILFTIFMAIVGFIVAMSIGRLPRITKLGKSYLERLQLAFEGMKYGSQAPYIGAHAAQPVAEAGFAGVDPLLLSVGVFGTGILVGTAFSGYNDAFARAQQQSAGSSSSCGSGCGSSCSSGDGGGGCGGCS